MGSFPKCRNFTPIVVAGHHFPLFFFLFLFGVYDISGPNHFRKCDKRACSMCFLNSSSMSMPLPSRSSPNKCSIGTKQAQNGRKNLPVSVKLRKKPISLPVELQSWPFSLSQYMYVYVYIHMYRYFHLNKRWNHGQLNLIHSSKRHCLFSSSCSNCIAWDIPGFAWEDHKWVKIEEI